MGFLIRDGGDTQLLTAGHCGHSSATHNPSPDIDWWHPGLNDGKIGNKWHSNLYDVAGSPDVDIMSVRVQFTYQDNIAREIYGFNPEDFNGVGTVMQGEYLCMSLGFTNRKPCGSVGDASTVWRSERCECLVKGAAINTTGTFEQGSCPNVPDNDGTPTLCGGDSGSPIYRKIPISGFPNYYEMTPMGVADHEYYDTQSERQDYGSYDVFFAKVMDAKNAWDFALWAP